MKRLLFALILSLAFITNCSDNSNNPTSSGSEGERIGAVCKDGSTSTATGSGACSHHGGVDHWIYK